jgi:hypothetical protein
MKKTILTNLTNEMINILLIDLAEENATEESQTIKFKHYNKDLIAKAVAAARPKYSLEWSADIIRDEVYATLYESMVIVSKDMDIEDIKLDNPTFAGPVYNMTMLKIKTHLIPESKKSNGKVIEVQEIAASQLGVNENGQALTIEDILAGQDIAVLMGAKEEKMNQFLNWFNNNKKNILTKKQLSYLENENKTSTDSGNQSAIRKRIAERVSKTYQEHYGDVSPRIANLMDQQRILETILDAKDFRATLNDYMEEDFIIDAITTHVSMNTMKSFNKGANAPEGIKEYRIALFKKLGEVISMLEAAK